MLDWLLAVYILKLWKDFDLDSIDPLRELITDLFDAVLDLLLLVIDAVKELITNVDVCLLDVVYGVLGQWIAAAQQVFPVG